MKESGNHGITELQNGEIDGWMDGWADGWTDALRKPQNSAQRGMESEVGLGIGRRKGMETEMGIQEWRQDGGGAGLGGAHAGDSEEHMQRMEMETRNGEGDEEGCGFM